MTDEARPLCVLLVEDSATVRAWLRDALDQDPRLHVVGEARDGLEGVRLGRVLRPDLVVLDIDLPGLDGVEVTRRLLALQPVPILVFCGTTGDPAHRGFEALRAGAMALVEKPRPGGDRSPAAAAREVVERLHVLAGVRAVRWRAKFGTPPTPRTPPPLDGPGRVDVVGIAASTGGPAALATILGRLPADLRAPVLVAQHMTPGFTDGLARWLSSVGRLPVVVARGGERPAPGTVYLAADGCSLWLGATGLLGCDRRPDGALVRPSCDLLLDSLARTARERALGVVLTGMGSDGAAGLRALRAAGGRTLAQEAASCAVASMPLAALEAGGAEEALPLEALAARIVRLAGLAGAPGR